MPVISIPVSEAEVHFLPIPSRTHTRQCLLYPLLHVFLKQVWRPQKKKKLKNLISGLYIFLSPLNFTEPLDSLIPEKAIHSEDKHSINSRKVYYDEDEWLEYSLTQSMTVGSTHSSSCPWIFVTCNLLHIKDHRLLSQLAHGLQATWCLCAGHEGQHLQINCSCPVSFLSFFPPLSSEARRVSCTYLGVKAGGEFIGKTRFTPHHRQQPPLDHFRR